MTWYGYSTVSTYMLEGRSTISGCGAGSLGFGCRRSGDRVGVLGPPLRLSAEVVLERGRGVANLGAARKTGRDRDRRPIGPRRGEMRRVMGLLKMFTIGARFCGVQ